MHTCKGGDVDVLKQWMVSIDDNEVLVCHRVIPLISHCNVHAVWQSVGLVLVAVRPEVNLYSSAVHHVSLEDFGDR